MCQACAQPTRLVHGMGGFRTFSHARAVFHQLRFNIAKLAD